MQMQTLIFCIIIMILKQYLDIHESRMRWVWYLLQISSQNAWSHLRPHRAGRMSDGKRLLVKYLLSFNFMARRYCAQILMKIFFLQNVFLFILKDRIEREYKFHFKYYSVKHFITSSTEKQKTANYVTIWNAGGRKV